MRSEECEGFVTELRSIRRRRRFLVPSGDQKVGRNQGRRIDDGQTAVAECFERIAQGQPIDGLRTRGQRHEHEPYRAGEAGKERPTPAAAWHDASPFNDH